jgi:predicted dehydrogenase
VSPQAGTLDFTPSAMNLYQADKLVETITVDDATVNTLAAQFAHCVKALRTGTPSRCAPDRALDMQKLIEAAYRSDAAGEVMRVR